MTAEWWFKPSSEGSGLLWDWCGAPPPVYSLAPVRRTRSSEHNRHIPVTAFSTTTGGHLALESGLEHDLVRRLDRLSSVTWLVAQPVELRWTEPRKFRHVPDLLSTDAGGAVTLWDVRNPRRLDEKFTLQSDKTRSACAAVGWRYEVFTGLGEVERLNLLWLHGYRRRPSWQGGIEEAILATAAGRCVVLDDLFALDDGSGQAKSAVWHLVWNGTLQVDLESKLTGRTSVRITGDGTDG
ncbi:TnsA-like heteromeric transposase endonuclease subunit [Rhodococcus sp. 7Tela_A2]|uniref:TnsA-like heteromeric transposase endonuclease subunit n=1 Tax=Rhodococcus sp. 7Tela_A2 TaxID=3093744 RepID=UPI003BB675A8